MNGGESAQAKAAAEAAKNDPKNKCIPVPDDPTLRSAPCPICQEKFEPSFDDESQDFLWRDAIQIGSRVYHASCHAEVRKDGASTPMRTGTPDSVLGKRKAGVSTEASDHGEEVLTDKEKGIGFECTETETSTKSGDCCCYCCCHNCVTGPCAHDEDHDF